MSGIPKTFVASVRCDLRDIAVIAKFLSHNNWEAHAKSGGVLASTAIRILADHLRKVDPECNVERTEEAVGVLRTLGYGESVVPGRRDFKPLLKQMSNENLEMTGHSSYGQPSTSKEKRIADEAYAKELAAAEELSKKYKDSKKVQPINTADIPGVEAILGPDDSESESEPESKQLKERTPADEAKDIKKLKSAMAIPDGAPLENLEEITPRTGTDND